MFKTEKIGDSNLSWEKITEPANIKQTNKAF
jgi:hypothetical protein